MSVVNKLNPPSITKVLQRNFKHYLHTSLPFGNASNERHVPSHIKKPEYYFQLMRPGCTLGEPEIKTDKQIQCMRNSCRLAAHILQSCQNLIKPGLTTNEIDAYVHDQIIRSNAYPSPLRYAGFPKSVCTSVNNVACHGVPDDRMLSNGDIINVDVTVYYNGYHGDCSRTFAVGDLDIRSQFLIDTTAECLMKSITLCKSGIKFNVIGNFISKYAKQNNLSVIHAFIGHGIGSFFHMPPEIWHHQNNMPGRMKTGMTFTIEPILTLGCPDIEVLDDGWTAITVDRMRNAQFEHTILITDDGAEILTKCD